MTMDPMNASFEQGESKEGEGTGMGVAPQKAKDDLSHLKRALEQSKEQVAEFTKLVDELKTPWRACYVCHDTDGVAPRVSWPLCQCKDKICVKCVIPYLKTTFHDDDKEISLRKLWGGPSMLDSSGTSFPVMFEFEQTFSTKLQVKCGSCRLGEVSLFLSPETLREAPEKSVLVFDSLQSCSLCKMSFPREDSKDSKDSFSRQVFMHYLWDCPFNELPCPFSPTCTVKRHPIDRGSKGYREAQKAFIAGYRRQCGFTNADAKVPLAGRSVETTFLLQLHLAECNATFLCTHCEQEFSATAWAAHLKTECAVLMAWKKLEQKLATVKEEWFKFTPRRSDKVQQRWRNMVFTLKQSMEAFDDTPGEALGQFDDSNLV
jgi:hypothetical protein